MTQPIFPHRGILLSLGGVCLLSCGPQQQAAQPGPMPAMAPGVAPTQDPAAAPTARPAADAPMGLPWATVPAWEEEAVPPDAPARMAVGEVQAVLQRHMDIRTQCAKLVAGGAVAEAEALWATAPELPWMAESPRCSVGAKERVTQDLQKELVSLRVNVPRLAPADYIRISHVFEVKPRWGSPLEPQCQQLHDAFVGGSADALRTAWLTWLMRRSGWGIDVLLGSDRVHAYHQALQEALASGEWHQPWDKVIAAAGWRMEELRAYRTKCEGIRGLFLQGAYRQAMQEWERLSPPQGWCKQTAFLSNLHETYDPAQNAERFERGAFVHLLRHLDELTSAVEHRGGNIWHVLERMWIDTEADPARRAVFEQVEPLLLKGWTPAQGLALYLRLEPAWDGDGPQILEVLSSEMPDKEKWRALCLGAESEHSPAAAYWAVLWAEACTAEEMEDPYGWHGPLAHLASDQGQTVNPRGGAAEPRRVIRLFWESWADRLPEGHSGRPLALRMQAMDRMGSGRWQEAIGKLEAVWRRQPTREVACLLVECHHRLGDWDAVQRWFWKADAIPLRRMGCGLDAERWETEDRLWREYKRWIGRKTGVIWCVPEGVTALCEIEKSYAVSWRKSHPGFRPSIAPRGHGSPETNPAVKEDMEASAAAEAMLAAAAAGQDPVFDHKLSPDARAGLTLRAGEALFPYHPQEAKAAFESVLGYSVGDEEAYWDSWMSPYPPDNQASIREIRAKKAEDMTEDERRALVLWGREVRQRREEAAKSLLECHATARARLDYLKKCMETFGGTAGGGKK